MAIFYPDSEMQAIGRTVLFNFFLILILTTSAQTLTNPEVHYLAQSSVQQTIVNNYSEAKRYNEILTKHLPNYPLPYLLTAFNQISESLDFETSINSQLVESNLVKAGTLIDSILSVKESAENYFLAGAWKAISAYYNLIQKNYFNAFTNSIAAVDDFNECVKFDPGYPEALVVIGSYRFWLNDKLKSLSWFSSKEKNSIGINLIKRGIKGAGNLLRPLGFESLIWIYIHKGKIEQAVSSGKRGLELYPNSRFFRDALAHAYSHINKVKAVEQFRLLLKDYKATGRNVNYQEGVIRSKIAFNLFYLNKLNEALDECEKALQIKAGTARQQALLNKRRVKLEQLKKMIVKKLLK